MSRYTRQEFEDAGLSREECDYCRRMPDGFACAYHEGWIDACNARETK